MRSLKSVLWSAARLAGAGHLIEARFGTEPVVLMYHRFAETPATGRVSREQLAEQLEFLARHCHVISMEDFLRGLRSGAPWPPYTTVLTVDDGYRDFYDIAFPLLKRYRIPATLFVTTGFVDGQLWHWPDQLRYLLAQCREAQLAFDGTGRRFELPLESPQQREQAWHRLADHCFQLDEVGRAEFLIALGARLRTPLPQMPPPEYDFVTWEQLREMAEHGVTIAAHSVTHARLAALADDSSCHEIVESKRRLEAQLGRAVTTFAYPYGAAADSNERVHAAARDAGFEAAFVAFFDAQMLADRHALRRFGVGPEGWDFVKTVQGLKRASCIYRR